MYGNDMKCILCSLCTAAGHMLDARGLICGTFMHGYPHIPMKYIVYIFNLPDIFVSGTCMKVTYEAHTE